MAVRLFSNALLRDCRVFLCALGACWVRVVFGASVQRSGHKFAVLAARHRYWRSDHHHLWIGFFAQLGASMSEAGDEVTSMNITVAHSQTFPAEGSVATSITIIGLEGLEG